MSNNFHVNPKEERLNQLREEALNQMKKELFLMEFDEIKRAVKYFKIIRKKRIGGTSDFYDIAINALERQIPQKPREHYHWGDFTKEEKLENNQWFCGKCGWQIGEEDNYCNECGQKVDWS